MILTSIPRYVRGACSVREASEDERNEQLIAAKDAQVAANRKTRSQEKIKGQSPRDYYRDQRRAAEDVGRDYIRMKTEKIMFFVPMYSVEIKRVKIAKEKDSRIWVEEEGGYQREYNRMDLFPSFDDARKNLITKYSMKIELLTKNLVEFQTNLERAKLLYEDK